VIVILEGMEGSGKSTLAASLSSALELPVYRPFRTVPNEHMDGDSSLLKELQDMGVRPNTYVEDLYVADVLTGTMANVILDRSMPSGFAYGMLQKAAPRDILGKALDYWLWRLSARTDVLYVDLRVSKATSRQRAVGRDQLFQGVNWTFLDDCLQLCSGEARRRFKWIQVDAEQPKGVVLQKVIMEAVR
jgi:thymidylate kinase